MIETTVLNYILDKSAEGLIEGIDDNVFMEVPESLPERYIVIEKVGGGRENQIDRARIAVQSISGTSLAEAARINRDVIDIMDQFAAESPDVYSCRLETDYNFTNTRTREYRYQAVFNLTY